MAGIAERREHPPPMAAAGFLLRCTTPGAVFTPEDCSAEQRMHASAARAFVDREVVPVSERIEGKDLPLLRTLVRRAGDLGLTAAGIPEEFGGLGLGVATATLIYDQFAAQASFMNTYGGQVGIGCLPIVYYGSRELKQRYLPPMARGDSIGSFCLTEPTAGSDAMACRTRAVLSADGCHYVLDGTKQFITNAGIADVFIVFAKVDGKHMTAFVLERDTPGLSIGREERKMGLRGASTASVILEGARIPVANVLGEVGRGHKIAFNTLNIGRLKQGVAGAGGARLALGHALAYCLERKQFGKRIAEFGAIREKLGEMFVRLYALEASAYRVMGMVDESWNGNDGASNADLVSRFEAHSVECSMVKVIGSEVLDYVVDEALQCFGGYGYCSDYPAERFYRDSRINRIFEGTNEINRLLIPVAVLRDGAEALLEASERVPPGAADQDPVVNRIKQLSLLAMGLAVRKLGEGLPERQAVMLRLADLMMGSYIAESAVLRSCKDAGRRGTEGAAVGLAAARIAVERAMGDGERAACEVITAVCEGQERQNRLEQVRAMAHRDPIDTLTLRELIASKLIESGRVPDNGE